MFEDLARDIGHQRNVRQAVSPAVLLGFCVFVYEGLLFHAASLVASGFSE